jgi:hypothetical protein
MRVSLKTNGVSWKGIAHLIEDFPTSLTGSLATGNWELNVRIVPSKKRAGLDYGHSFTVTDPVILQKSEKNPRS